MTILILIIILALSACANENNCNEAVVDIIEMLSSSQRKERHAENTLQETDVSYLQNKAFLQTEFEDIETAHYINQDVYISYPQILNSEAAQLNELIKREAIEMFLVNYYENENNLVLEISYAITFRNEKLLSIVFYGYGNKKDTAHPNRHFCTLNVDLENMKKICLKNVINDFEKFISTVKNKNFIFKIYDDNGIETLMKVNELIDFESLEKSDVLGSEIYSYFTENGLGISFGVPYAIGDHKEIEIPYNELTELLLT